MRRVSATLIFCLLTVSFEGTSTADPPTSRASANKLTRSDALELARAAAQREGIDVSKYVLDTFGGSGKLTPDGEWLFDFACSPPETRPPGCDILVSVDRSTGEIKVMGGE